MRSFEKKKNNLCLEALLVLINGLSFVSFNNNNKELQICQVLMIMLIAWNSLWLSHDGKSFLYGHFDRIVRRVDHFYVFWIFNKSYWELILWTKTNNCLKTIKSRMILTIFYAKKSRKTIRDMGTIHPIFLLKKRMSQSMNVVHPLQLVQCKKN